MMDGAAPIPRLLTIALAILMAMQAGTGRLLHDQYRDVELIRTTWIGNDWITLTLAVPLLAASAAGARRGSIRSVLLWLGMVGYGVYNYAFYLFGAALNAFFPLYVLAFVTATVTLILALARIDVGRVHQAFDDRTPVHVLGGFLAVVGVGLACVWMGLWAGYAFGGRPTPLDPEAFKLVAALDLTLMVPALTIGGALLWKRMAWGYVISSVASIQGALYLFVLAVNSAIAIRRGLVAAPGELPLWTALAILTTAAAVMLLAHVRADHTPIARTF